jgi:DNA polymerase-3 subunit alpha
MSEWPTNIKLSMEREALGFYLSGHPLERFSGELSRLGVASTEAVRTKQDGSNVVVAGVVTILKLKNTKKGDRYASFVLEDLKGTMEVLVWPDTYKKVHELLNSEEPLLLKARVDVSDERVVLVANELSALADIRDSSAEEAHIVLKDDLITPSTLSDLKKTLNKYKGTCKVKVSIKKAKHSEVIMSLPDDYKISPSEEFCIELERLFGAHVVSFR